MAERNALANMLAGRRSAQDIMDNPASFYGVYGPGGGSASMKRAAAFNWDPGYMDSPTNPLRPDGKYDAQYSMSHPQRLMDRYGEIQSTLDFYEGLKREARADEGWTPQQRQNEIANLDHVTGMMRMEMHKLEEMMRAKGEWPPGRVYPPHPKQSDDNLDWLFKQAHP